jgi:hypothetical protein
MPTEELKALAAKLIAPCLSILVGSGPNVTFGVQAPSIG